MPINCPSGPILLRCWFVAGSILVLFLFALSAAGDRRKGEQETNEKRIKQAESKEEPYIEPREVIEISRPATRFA